MRTYYLPLLALAGLTLASQAQPARPEGPCDIYGAAGTPCVTAHSTVRSLSSRYAGPLYQVKRQDGRLLDIGVVAGFADAAAQDRFCAGTICVINRIYDQSGKGNDLMQAPPGPLYPGPDKGAFDAQPIADMAPISIGGGRKAYGVYIMPGMGFRNNKARDLPIDDEPAGIVRRVGLVHRRERAEPGLVRTGRPAPAPAVTDAPLGLPRGAAQWCTLRPSAGPAERE